MAIKKKRNRKLTLNLDGPDGNAYVLLGTCKDIARQLRIPFDPIHTEATSKDYTHLVKTLNKYFGEFIDFETSNSKYLTD